MARKNWGAVVLLSLFLWSCKGPDVTPSVPVTPSGTGEVLVVCEGSLGNGNSALTKLSADTTQAANEDVFYSVNGQQLGDVFQSVTHTGNELALCINNSDKIVFINPSDYRLQHTLSIPKPRYLLPTTGNRAYVSTLFSNRVFEVDLSSHSITDTLYLPHKNPEGMLYLNGLLYVACWDTTNSFLYRINTATNAIQDSFSLNRRAPQSLLLDKGKNLWVIAGNDLQGKGIPPSLTCLNPQTGAVVKQYDFPAGKDVMKPCFNTTRDTLYWISVDYNGGNASGVFRMPISATSLPQMPFVAAGNFQYFYALGIQPQTGKIYVGDPKGFTQRGEVSAYTPAGIKLYSWKTGVGPGFFYFL